MANDTYFLPGKLTVLLSWIILSGWIGRVNDLNARVKTVENNTVPEILVHGMVTPADVEKLFEMYVFPAYCTECANKTYSFFARLNASVQPRYDSMPLICLQCHVSVLDPVLHTPATTFARCPFLFTVSKYCSILVRM